MNTPFKMKGWSPFTQKTHPKHPVTPPTEEQKKKPESSKGTLTGSEATQTESPDNPHKKKTELYYWWEAENARKIRQGRKK